MSEAAAMAEQFDPLETAATRSLLDQLVADSQLYTIGKDYKRSVQVSGRVGASR